MNKLEAAIAALRAARLAFKLAGKGSLMASTDELISEAMDELRADEREVERNRQIERVH